MRRFLLWGKVAMLRLNNVEIRYMRYILAVKGVSLKVPKGSFEVILGTNGSGKSSLLKGVAGLLPLERGGVTKGAITYTQDGHEERLDHLSPMEIVKRGIVLVPEGRRIFTELTAEENLLSATYTRRKSPTIKEDLETVYEYFPQLKKRATVRSGYFSGGELQMLAIGRALMAKPNFLILDEPSLGLAPLLVSLILEVLKELNQKGMTILLVEQFAEAALNVADYVSVMEKGRIVVEGKPEEIRNHPNVREFYLGIVGSEVKKMKDIKFYRRKKRWSSI